MTGKTWDAVVVGAGLTGLSAAYRLSQKGLNVVVLEKGATPGGVIRTEQRDGYQLEWGPHTFLSTAEEINALCDELGITPIAADSRAKKRYVYHQDRLCPVPMSPGAFLATPLLSWGSKLRLMTEPFQPGSSGEEESVAQFTRRRLGEEVLQNLMGPFLSGVYAGDPEALSLPAVFPKLAAMERDEGSLLKGVWAQRKKGDRSQKHRAYELLSFEQGMESLIQALAQAMPDSVIRYQTTLTEIRSESTGYRLTLESGEHLQAESVILTTPAGVSSNVLRSFWPTVSNVLKEISYAPIGVVHLGFRRSEAPYPLDGFGFLIPRKAGLDTLGVIWVSSLFPNRAPEGHVLLSAFIGGALHPTVANWNKEQLVDQLLSDYARIFQHPLSPAFSSARVLKRAIPQYTLGHLERIRQIEALLKNHKGLVLAGNYLSGVSVNDCVRQGAAAAQKILAAKPVLTR